MFCYKKVAQPNLVRFQPEIEGTPPEIEANTEEAPDFKKARAEAY